jgi:autotransporter-associated beta strand protein
LNYTGTGDSTDRLFTIQSGNATINNSGAGPLNFTNTGAIALASAQATTLALGGTYTGPTANTFAPAITDNGALPTTVAVNGSLWTITGTNNTYTGGTTLSGGTMLLTGATQTALQNSTVAVYGGKLAFAGGVTSPVVLGGLAGNNGAIVLQDANSTAVTLSVGANNNSTAFAGILSGPGGLTKTGSGLLALSMSQTYAGPTVVNGGTLQISSPQALNGFGGNGTGWTFNRSGANANIVGVSGNQFTLTNSVSANTTTSLWYNTPLPMAGTPWTVTFTYLDSSGSGADGACLVLQSSPAGVLALGNTAGGGFEGFAGIAPSAGMAMRIFTSSDLGFVTSPGSATNIDNAATTPLGSVNLRSPTPVNFTVTYDGSANLMVSATQGANTYNSPAIPETLMTVLSGSGGYAYLGFTGADGSTTSTQIISNFNLTMSSGPSVNVLPVNTPLTVNAGGTFDLDGGTQAVGSLSGAGTVTNSYSNVNYPGGALLTLGNEGTNQTFSGTISGNLALTKVGSGTQTLSGANSYTGGTTINAGALMFASVSAVPATGLTTVNYGGGLVAQGAYADVNAWLGASPQAINASSAGAILLTPSSTDTDVNFTTSPGYNTLSLGALGAVTYNGTIEPGTGGYYLGGGGGTLTLVNSVTGATALTINGPGMVVLSASPGYTGSTTVNTGGVLDLGGNTLTTSAPVALLGGTIQDGTISSATDYVIQSGLVSANLGGPVNLFKTTAGSASLTGANSYTGVTNINGGILNLGSAGAIPSGGTISFGGGTMQFSSANTHDYSAKILGSTASISIDPNGQSVTFATALDASNTAGLTVNGTGGTLTLSATGLYSGATTVNGSFLALTGSGNILPASSNITTTAGTLDLGGNGQTTSGTVSFRGGVTQNGTITNNTVTYDGQAGTVTASLAGNVGLNKTTAGILHVDGVNSYTGSTTLSAGVLSLGNNASLGSGTLALTAGSLEADTTLSGVSNPVVVIGNPGTLVLGGSNSFTLSGNLTNTGTNHTLTITNTNSVVTISGNIYTSESQGTGRSLSFNSGVANSALVLSGNIADSSLGTTSGTAGTLTIQPNVAGDTVLISGTNTYTGTTSLGGNALGIITFTNSSAFGTSTVSLNKTQIQASTNLALNNNFSTTGNGPDIFSGSSNLTINGSFTNTANASFLNNGTGLLTLTGNVFLTSSSGAVNTLTLGGSGTTIVSGAIANFNGTSGTQDALAFSGTGGGILYITGTNNSYTGPTNISAGTVNVANLSNYGVNGSLGNRAQSAEGTLTDPNGPIGIHIGSVNTGATLQYTGSTAQSTNRQIRLSAANNTIDASSNLPSATMNFAYSGTNVNLWDTGGTRSLTLGGSNTGNNLFAINLQDQAGNATSLIKSGPGTWVVTNSANGVAGSGVSGQFTGFSGGTTINAGLLIAQAPGAIGEVGKALNLAGGTLDIQTNTSINALNTTVSGNATIVSDKLTAASPGITQALGTLSIGTDTLSIATGGNVSGGAPAVSFGATTLTGSATFSPAAGTTLTLSGNVNGAYGIDMSGAGTMVLSGTNGYLGDTVVANGTLIATNSEAIPDGSNLTVGAGGAFPAPVVPASAPQAAAPVSSVPEPGTIALVAAGAMALLVRARRRYRKA